MLRIISSLGLPVEKLRRALGSLGLIEALQNAGACVGVLCAKPAPHRRIAVNMKGCIVSMPGF